MPERRVGLLHRFVILSTLGAGMPLMQFIRGISAAQFAGIVLLFFLPFIEVSCSNIVTVEITGQQFATGGRVDVTAPSDSSVALGAPPTAAPSATTARSESVEMKPSALVAWVAAFIGVVVSLMADRRMRVVSAAVGGLGAVAMFWLKSEIDGDFGRGVEQARGLITLEYEFAFWACLVLFIAAATTNVFAILRPPDGARP